jgi:hypothetical protein
LTDQLAEILRQARSASVLRIPPPEGPERTAVPLQESFRLDDDKSVAPVKEPGKHDHHCSCDGRRMPRLRLALLKQRQLFAKEKVLSDKGGARGK